MLFSLYWLLESSALVQIGRLDCQTKFLSKIPKKVDDNTLLDFTDSGTIRLVTTYANKQFWIQNLNSLTRFLAPPAPCAGTRGARENALLRSERRRTNIQCDIVLSK